MFSGNWLGLFFVLLNKRRIKSQDKLGSRPWAGWEKVRVPSHLVQWRIWLEALQGTFPEIVLLISDREHVGCYIILDQWKPDLSNDSKSSMAIVPMRNLHNMATSITARIKNPKANELRQCRPQFNSNKDPWERTAIHSSTFCLRILRYSPWGHKAVGHNWVTTSGGLWHCSHVHPGSLHLTLGSWYLSITDVHHSV